MTSHFPILLILLMAAGAATAQSNPVEVKPRITESELLRLVKSEQTVTGKTIPASGLIKAMRWLQQRGRVERGPLIGLRVKDCIVEGVFTFYDGLEYPDTPQDHVDDVKVQLAQTPVDLLAPEVAKPYKDAGFDKVIVIPFYIQFHSTKFTAQSQFSFLDTVFEETVNFDTVDFGKALVRFDSSAFLKESRFDTCTFESGVSFSGAAFKNKVDFSGSRFMEFAEFSATEFKEDVMFSSWSGHDLRFDESALFRQAMIRKTLTFSFVTFGGITDFSESEINGRVIFNTCKIESDAFFSDLNRKAEMLVGRLRFHQTTFSERAYFNNAKLDKLSFSPQTDDTEASEEFKGWPTVNSPVVFAKRARFAGLKCNSADFREVEFRDYADLSDARFINYLNLSDATFEGGVNFFGARFPSNTGTTNLFLNGVQFSKGVTVDWSQLGNSLDSANLDTLRRMEGVFKQLGDLEGQNEVLFRRKHLEGSQSGRWHKLINRAELAFWGYGVRPLRLLGWMFALFVVMTIVYWTQTRSLATRGTRIKNAWRRLTFALAFCLRTSWSLGFGYKNARTRLFQALTLIHSIAFKILFILLLQAFANTSPLLNQLVGKLIHI